MKNIDSVYQDMFREVSLLRTLFPRSCANLNRPGKLHCIGLLSSEQSSLNPFCVHTVSEFAYVNHAANCK